LNLPSFSDVIEANRSHILRTGGHFEPPDNLVNPESLLWIMDAIRFPLGETDLYPTLTEKAAILAHTIICKHVFGDGNKRTGLSVLQTTLTVNGYRFTGTIGDVISMGFRLADSSNRRPAFGELLAWTRDRLSL